MTIITKANSFGTDKCVVCNKKLRRRRRYLLFHNKCHKVYSGIVFKVLNNCSWRIADL